MDIANMCGFELRVLRSIAQADKLQKQSAEDDFTAQVTLLPSLDLSRSLLICLSTFPKESPKKDLDDCREAARDRDPHGRLCLPLVPLSFPAFALLVLSFGRLPSDRASLQSLSKRS